MLKFSAIFCLIFMCTIHTNGQTIPPYKNSKLPVQQRVEDLLSRMTPEEKFWQLFMIPGDLDNAKPNQYHHGIFGLQVSASAVNADVAQQMMQYGKKESVSALINKINRIQHYFVDSSRLGIPIIAFDEALHGIVRDSCTVFPQAIGLAATFDTTLVRKVSAAIAMQCRTRGLRQILSPVINMANDVRWGRVEETYGEDPFLTAEMGVAFVNEFEKRNIITTPKHLLANVGDGGRDSYPIHFNERLLREIHLPPFEAVFKRGGTRSVMTSYNSLDGTPCTSNTWLLNSIVKKEWGFSGFVISDAGAVGGANVLHYTAKDYPEASKQAIAGGLDVIFQTAYEHHPLFDPPFLDGSLDTQTINNAVRRVLKAKFELGLFEQPYVPEIAETVEQINAYKKIAKDAAVASMVLLKNNHKVLPLSNKIGSIALIGTDATEARLGGYSGPGAGKISILDGLKKRLGSRVQINYAPGCGRSTDEWKIIQADALSTVRNGKVEKGLLGEYFNNVTLSGKPTITRTDASLNFHWTLFSPDEAINLDFYSARWTGNFTAPASGKYKIGLNGNDGYRLYINNTLLIDNWIKQGFTTVLKDYVFEKGKQYAIKVEFYEANGNATIQLVADFGVVNDWQKKIAEAVALAKKSDVAVVAAGITEGEFLDRAMLTLPGHQEELIQQVAATGKPVVVLLVGGSAITMNSWRDKVDGILDVWYPGEEGGHAVAAVLMGDENPAGRLPITFPVHESQLPLVYNHKPTGRGDDYNNLSGLPMYPFGFGLSYTTFEYSNMQFERNNIASNESVKVHCTITNTGDRDGDEVVQLYIRDLLSSISRPVMELKGFERIHLKKGESKNVTFTITPEMLAMLNAAMQKVIEPGNFSIMIGASSRDIKLRDILTVK